MDLKFVASGVRSGFSRCILGEGLGLKEQKENKSGEEK